MKFRIPSEHQDGHIAMKIILIGGILVFIFLFFSALTMKRALKPDETQRVTVGKHQTPFDGTRAFQDLERIVAFGPRPSGSEALEKTRDFIVRQLEAAGLSVRRFPFEAATLIGKVNMVNLVGIIKGTSPDIILIGNHYETKLFTDFTFVGANDGGSTTAWMLEMARAIGPTRQGRTIWLCFFDGEEAFKTWSREDSLYGSRHLVETLKKSGELSSVKTMINVDMIGDAYLGIHRDPDAPKWLHSIIWDTAERMGYGKHFSRRGMTIEDDHIPFREAGIPTIELIDFMYGGSVIDHQRTWHTPNDTLDKVSAASLQAVGDVIYNALFDIDAYLDTIK